MNKPPSKTRKVSKKLVRFGGVSVSIQKSKHRHYKHVVSVRVNGKRKVHYCVSKSEAEVLAQKFQIETINQGTDAALSITEEDKRKLMLAKEQLKPFGKTVWDAVDNYVSQLKRCQASIPVDSLAEQMLHFKTQEGASLRYLQDLEWRLNPFREIFGERIAADVTTTEISDWLRSLTVSAASVKNYSRSLSVLFSYGQSINVLEVNPVQKAFKPKVAAPEIGVLRPVQVGQYLKVAHECGEEILPIICLGLFAGIRTAELQRLHWEDVNLSTGYIRIPANKAKTKTIRKIEIKAVLRSWLAPIHLSSGPIWPEKAGRGDYLLKKVRSQVIKPWPSNAARHCYGTYSALMSKNVQAVSFEMGNSPGIVDKHYHNADLELPDAELFWNLTRQTVLSNQ